VVFAKQIERQLNADSIAEKKKKFPNSQQLRRHVALPNVATCLQAICCNIQEFCCNGLQGVTWSYMALQDHLVSVTAIFFHVMCKLPVSAYRQFKLNTLTLTYREILQFQK
jgi:hypothetical protein